MTGPQTVPMSRSMVGWEPTHRLTSLILFAVAAGAVPIQADQTAPAIDPRRRTPVVEVFESARNAVVSITTTQILEVRSPLEFGRVFPDFFWQVPRRRYERMGIGSGFVLHPAGYIVTNAHVVARTAERKIVFASGEKYDADVVALDSEHDLAVLKIKADHPLQPVQLGNSVDLMVGETVIAIGNPLGYQHTVTAGVVSALNRSLPIDERRSFEDLIQTDASINPGNSGGPLLNILGELVGINTAIRADAENIGFAIPVDRLRALLPELLDVERRYRITTGLRVEDGPTNCRVVEVVSGSPADHAGLKVGDLIDSVAEKTVTNAIDFHICLIGRKAGQTILLTTVQRRRYELTLAARPRPDGTKLLLAKLGIEAVQLSPAAARGLGIQRLRGLRVVGIERNGPAEGIDLRPGDILIQINRYHPTDLDEVGELLDQIKPSKAVEIGYLRFGRHTIWRHSERIRSR